MRIQTFGITLSAAGAVFLAAYSAELGELTTKKLFLPEKRVAIERTYRGKQCILLELAQEGKRTRVFRIKGQTVAAESDEDRDGFFESLMIFDPKTDDFEWFTRTTNGIVRPVTSAELNDAKSRKKNADKALYDLIEN